MSARVLQFRPRAPHVPRPVRPSADQVILLFILCACLANLVLITLGIVFIVRGFR